MVVGIGCKAVCNKLAIVVIVPIAEVNCASICSDTVHLGIYVTVNSLVFAYRTDQHACITVCVVLIVCTYIIIYVDLCSNVAVLQINTCIFGVSCRALSACGIILSYNTSASNVPRTPKSRDLVCVINCDVSECNLCICCLFCIPSYTTNNTAVTDIVNTRIASKNCYIFKCCSAVCICGDDTGGSILTIGAEVFNDKILNRTAVNLTKETHTVAVVLQVGSIFIIITLHIPGVLVYILYSVTVSVKGSLKRIEITCNTGCGIRISFICFFTIIVTYGIKHMIVSDIIRIVSYIDISNKHYGLTFEGIIMILITFSIGRSINVVASFVFGHTANKCTKCNELVCIGNIESFIGCIIPAVVKIAFPCRRSYGKRHNREGLDIKYNITCCGVVFIVVMYRSCAALEKCHLYCHTVFYVVEAVVTHIKSCGQQLLTFYSHYNIVICRDSINMNIESKHSLVLVKNYVSCAVINRGHS